MGIIEEPPRSDDEEEEPVAPKRVPQKQYVSWLWKWAARSPLTNRGVFSKQRRNTEQRLDDDISELLGSDESHSEEDSILDAGDSEGEEADNGEVAHEEEGEVNDLL